MARARLQLAANEHTVARVTVWTERFCTKQRLSRAVINLVSLSLEEIVSNIIVHGYDRLPGNLSIELHYDQGVLSIVIEDKGKPFDPTQAQKPPKGDTLMSRSEGGIGLLLVKKLMDDIRYQRAGATNRLKLVKRL
jgi:anti-sigma regulatory factor (Ser/Thr protein kinase)